MRESRPALCCTRYRGASRTKGITATQRILWIPSNLESHSPLRKAFAIAALILKQFILCIGSGLFCLSILLGGLIGIPVILAVSVENYISSDADTVASVLLASFVVMIAIFVYSLLKTRKRRVQAEATKWLADRSKTSARSSYVRWERRTKRWSMWGPVATALLVFLFLPETCAIVSHVLNPSAGRLYRYRVRIPLKWVAVGEWIEKDTGYSSMTTLTGKGLARDWRFLPQLSEVSVGTEEFEHRNVRTQQPNNLHLASTRTFSVGNVTITCWESVPFKQQWAYVVRVVDCSSSNGDLIASFVGQKADIPDFYDMLQSVKQTQ